MSAGETTGAERWAKLSPQARSAVLRELKAPVNKDSTRPPFISVERLAPELVKELTAADFAERRPGLTPRQAERLVVPPDAVDFVHWVRGLAEWKLLEPDGAERLPIYVQRAFYGPDLDATLRPVLRQGNVHDSFISRGILISQYVPNRRWPEWAARSLRRQLAEDILRVVEEAGGVLPVKELFDRLPHSKPAEVREMIRSLVGLLALFEGLRSGTWEMLVGLLEPVREGLRRARQPQVRPVLVLVEGPQELLPEGGYQLDDLRAFLVELASGSARLRQNHTLFQKEWGRFEAVLEPLPQWTERLLRLTAEHRLSQVIRWCWSLELARTVRREGVPWMELSKEGQAWLAGDLASQYRRLFEFLRRGPGDQELRLSSGYYSGDVLFLGLPLLVIETKGKTSSWWVDIKASDRERLRQSFYSALAELTSGRFVRLDSFLSHATFGPHNPLSLGGLEPAQVTVLLQAAPVPPLEEQREAAGRRSLELLITERLLPLGCLQAGIESEGWMCIARHPRLDAYFGKPVADEALGGPALAGARVLVQPDFSVFLIGTMPSAAAELAPFCERAGSRGGRGTLQLKITRAAVVAAVAGGLSGQEIEERLTRHSSVPVPANVLHEVREWAGWVRTAQAETLTVLRCPDRDTADRVASALGRQAQRLNETLVALPVGALGGAERSKLQQHGILIAAPGHGTSPLPRGRKKRR
jgi:hypothetical protein